MIKTTFKADRELQAEKAEGKPRDLRDFHTRNLAVRIMPSGQKTFTFVARFPGFKNPSRVALGDYPAMSLVEARTKADEWRKLIKAGVDPREAIREKKEKAARERDLTFGSIAETYISRKLKKQRRGTQAAYEIRRELIPAWSKKPISKITRGDVTTLIENIADRGPYHAHNCFGHVRAIFNWAIESGKYDLEISPCDRLKPKNLIGEKKPRQRVLSDDELAAFWRATGRMGYPYGSLFRFLLITGQRQSEAREAQWREFPSSLVKVLRSRDGEKARLNSNPIWTIPPERFKSESSHRVPISTEAMRVLEELPHFAAGKDYLFSATLGEKPVNGLSKAKSRLDARMLLALRAAARKRGDDPKAVQLPGFVLHDLRRTVRTRLSSLRVPTEIAEMIIGHGRKGLARVYDQYSAETEMSEALESWSFRLMTIVSPQPSNVVPLRKAH